MTTINLNWYVELAEFLSLLIRVIHIFKQFISFLNMDSDATNYIILLTDYKFQKVKITSGDTSGAMYIQVRLALIR